MKTSNFDLDGISLDHDAELNLLDATFDFHSDEPGGHDGDSASSPGTIPQLADQLVNGYWEATGRSARSWDDGPISVNLTGLSSSQANLARLSLELWEDIADVSFTFTTGAAEITFESEGSRRAYASSVTSGGEMIRSTINISDDWYGGSTSVSGYTMQTYIHEIGHALGLGHMGNYNGSANFSTDARFSNDSWATSVMSYFSQSTAGTGDYAFVGTPQLADIYAMQSMYGAATTRTGDTIYGGLNDNVTGALGTVIDEVWGSGSLTIYDSGGTDTIDASQFSTNQTIDLRGGAFSSINGVENNLAIYLTSVIENAIGGSGRDTLIGNDASNILNGGRGADNIDGGRGFDYVDYRDASSGLNVRLDAGYAIADGARDTLANIEGVHGSRFDDTMYGGTATETFYGYDGNDKLYGGRGGDRLYGGDGDDRNYGFSGDDYMYGQAGNDLLRGDAGNDYMSGGADDDRLYAGSGDDRLFGNSGIDLLDGSSGRDVYDGGSGNDRLYSRFDGDTDQFVFDVGTGTDRIFRYELDIDQLIIDPAFGFTSGADVIANAVSVTINANDDLVIQLNNSGDFINIVDFALHNPTATVNDIADNILIA